MKDNIPAEEFLLLKLFNALVEGNCKQEIADIISQNKINWKRFKELLIYHELIPFAYLIIKNHSLHLPSDFRELLKNNYYLSLIRYQKILKEFLKISSVFNQAAIPLLPIKGVSFLEDIYFQYPVRPMADIDLLTKEEDFKKAERILTELGYQKELYGLKEEYWLTHQYHITFHPALRDRRASIVELHWSLDYKRKGINLLPELWQRTRYININGNQIKVLSPEDAFLSLVLHNRRFGKLLCFKNIFDIAMILKKYASHFDWNYLLKQSRKYKLCQAVYFVLYQLKLTLDWDTEKFIGQELGIARWKKKVTERLIKGNLFLMQPKELFLKSHFLLYDNLWEPTAYILNIPQEQFAKFYGFEPYAKKTKFLYHLRFFYIPFELISALIRKKFLEREKIRAIPEI